MRDQDSIGWCYAFTAADLLTHKLGKKVSATDLALAYNDTWINNIRLFTGVYEGQSDMSGGLTRTAVKKGLDRGLCLEENLPSDDYAYSDLKEIIDKIEELKENSQKPQNCKKASELVNLLFPNLKPTEISKIIRENSKISLVNFLAKKACKKRIKPFPKIKLVNNRAFTMPERFELFDNIDSVLNNKQIVGMTYDVRILYNIDHEGDPGWHASVVAGRRFNEKTNSCDYLVRNSWGRSCNVYDPRLDCEEGNIWMPKKTLVKRLDNIDYIK